jgi:hypothetical protein
MASAENRLGRIFSIPLIIWLGFGTLGHDQPANYLPTDPQPVSAADREEFTHYFEQAQAFWVKQGVPGTADVRLLILSGDQEIGCDSPWLQTTSAGPTYYCRKDGTVVISAASIQAIQSPLYRLFLVGHESGHAVQDKKGELTAITPEEIVRQELGATCLSGVFMASTASTLVVEKTADGTYIHTPLFAVGGDEGHGTIAQQQAAFDQGFHTGDCSQYEPRPVNLFVIFRGNELRQNGGANG